jgi:amino acid adenylation domain-containing protein
MSAMNPEILVFDTELKEQRSYWLKRLSRRPEASSLTPDYDRPKEFVRAAEGVPLSIEGDLYAKLTKLTGRSPFLLLTTLMAALKVCLHKYQPGEPTFVGTPALEHVEGIKQQKNALVMVDEVDDRLPFRQLLLKVRETLLEAYAKPRYPFHRLARDLGLTDSEGRCPLFQVALVLTDIHGELPEVKNDLTLTFSLEGDKVSGVADYHAGLFHWASVERFTSHFVHVLGEALANPGARIHELLMLTEAERRLLAEWNETRQPYPHDRCAHELFEAQVERTPDSPAVVFQGRSLSYRELNERANRLARHLRASGVAPESRVGILLERSMEMVVALLGVLKAGGAYLPLDPDYPGDRLAFMLQDAGVRLLLTQRRLRASLPDYDGDIFCVEDEREWSAEYSPENLPAAATPLNLAYVIYTSGSTGQPKGTMATHRGLVNYLSWCTRAYRVAEGGGAPVHSPLGFDLTITSLFSPLMSGRPAVLLPEGEGVESFSRELRRGHDFSLVKITPAHLDVLAQLLGDGECAKTTRALVVGGEALRGESLEWWRRHAPEVRVINEYGPTEAVVGCCVYEVAARDVRPGAVPIGRPIANTQLYVLDERLELTPLGLPGQLYIGGEGLARGYLGRPDLTAETFIPNPFSAEPGARLYRAGDVVRHLPGGDLEYLGRVDHQVKVRGYRIELGEVEIALLRHEQVREAVAVVHAGPDGDKRLAAYVVAEGAGEEPEALAARWRDFLKEQLPDYMVPSAFVVLEAMPLTAHGKIDRRALPAPGPSGGGGYVEPRTAAEEVLAGIWAEVLGAARVGVRDDFFALGGHSLLATQVTSRVHQVFGVEVALRSLFEHPTVEGLAAEVERARGEQPAGNKMPPLVPVERDGGEGLPLSYAQQGLWFLHHLKPLGAAYNVPVAMRLTGRLGVAALEQTVNELVRRHESLRTTFANVRGQLRQIISEPGERRLPLIDLTRLPAPEQERVALRLAREEALRPFDLSKGPLLRVSLLRLGGEEHVVLFTMHHIVSDGWSMEVLVRELSEIHRAYVSLGVPSPLTPLPIQYADFAVWQRRLVEETLLDKQLAYWKERLGGTPPRLELPTDRPRPSINGYRGATHPFTLPARLTAELRALGRREGATLYMVLLSAFKALLALYSGQDEVVVGSPVANRVRVETEGLIGCLINTLALRTKVGGNPTFRELLARVREVVLSAHAHQEIPFELVVEALQPERRGNYNPLFQVWFVLQSGKGERIESAGLTLKPLNVGSRSAQFDLTLAMEEHGAEVAGSWNYSTDLFDPETVKEMAGHYRGLLESILTAADGMSCGILDISLNGAGAAPREVADGAFTTPNAHEEEGQYAF